MGEELPIVFYVYIIIAIDSMDAAMYDAQIELKNKEGKRTTVSIDKLIFSFYARLEGGEKQARSRIRKVFNGDPAISSRAVRSFILHSIVKDELLHEPLETEAP